MDNKLQVLVVFPTNEQHRTWLAEAAPQASFTYVEPQKLTEAQIAAADIILGNPPMPLLQKAKKLRLLQLNSAGSDAFVAPGVLPQNDPPVLLANATGSYGFGISEYMIAVLFALCKRLPGYRDLQNRASWQSLGEVKQVAGTTALILGLGDIGSEFALRLHALGCHVIGVRRKGADKPDFVDELRHNEDIDTLLPRADIVAMCLPNTPATQGLMNRTRIGMMKQDAMLINVGRGNAVDADALCDALDAGRLWGAALDVTDPEPLPAESRLWRTERLLLTPHVSGGYSLPETHNRIVKTAAGNLRAFLNGEPLKNLVDFETGYRKL